MLEILKAVIYGVLEGITEWLPISSTGHILLAQQLIPFKNVSEGFSDMFDVVIQLGAILAVVVLFFRQIWPFRMPDGRERGRGGLSAYIKPEIMTLWFKILVSCVPAAVIGLLFDDEIDALFYNPFCIAIALIVFGMAFIVIETWNRGRKAKITSLSQITYQTALLIGAFQLIAAVFPGTSRSGATIVGALLIGVSRTVAAEYTFFLAIPVMFGASLLKMVKFGFSFTAAEGIALAVGTAVAFAVSLFVLKFLLNYIKRHDFKVFGWYRIALGIVVLIFFWVMVP